MIAILCFGKTRTRSTFNGRNIKIDTVYIIIQTPPSRTENFLQFEGGVLIKVNACLNFKIYFIAKFRAGSRLFDASRIFLWYCCKKNIIKLVPKTLGRDTSIYYFKINSNNCFIQIKYQTKNNLILKTHK